jgi:hypothetical protein
MTRKSKTKRVGHLRHYGMYLDQDMADDRALIAFLEPYVEPRRVGGVLRAALLAYVNGGAVAPLIAPPLPTQMKLTNAMDGYMPTESADANDAAIKVKRAFFK